MHQGHPRRRRAPATYRIPAALRRDHHRPRLRAAIPILAVVLLASLVTVPVASANFITPVSGGSPNANSIASLYRIVLYMAAIVFLLVEGALVYSLFKFRAKKGAVAAQIHGNTRLEIGWTLGAALILVVLTVVTFVKLPSIVDPPNSDAAGLSLSASVTQPTPPNGKKLSICVQGRQYIWRYTYGNGCEQGAFSQKLPYSYTEMVVPVHTTVVLTLQASDVIHSWWIPKMGGKVDAVPGYTTYTWFKALHTGDFRGQCAQLCGMGHAAMFALVHVVTPAQYQAWLTAQSQKISAASAQVSQLRQILISQNALGN